MGKTSLIFARFVYMSLPSSSTLSALGMAVASSSFLRMKPSRCRTESRRLIMRVSSFSRFTSMSDYYMVIIKIMMRENKG